jgi:hypothetical protein
MLVHVATVCLSLFVVKPPVTLAVDPPVTVSTLSQLQAAIANASYSHAPIDVVADINVTENAEENAGVSISAGTTVRLQSSVGATLSGASKYRILYVAGGAVLYLDGLSLVDGIYHTGACISPYASGSAVYVAGEPLLPVKSNCGPPRSPLLSTH